MRSTLGTILASSCVALACSKTDGRDQVGPLGVVVAGRLEPVNQSIKHVMADAVMLDERAVIVSEAHLG